MEGEADTEVWAIEMEADGGDEELERG